MSENAEGARMRILAVDVGTGTQDILLFDTDLQVENCFKLVMPSPTMMIARRVRAATKRGQPLLLTGVTMGGGPSHWAVRDHAGAGHEVFATPQAARTFDDDLSNVQAMGVRVVSEDEAAALARSRPDLLHLTLHDFDYGMIRRAFEAFGLELKLDGVAVAVFDHGAAPPGISDRQFRFDYLDERIRAHNRLSAFAFPADRIPEIMTRLQSVVTSAAATGLSADVPLMVMDTAPAAVLGATLDPQVGGRESVIITNVGNFHTLAFRLGPAGIEGVFEHHTGFLDAPKLDGLLQALAASTLQHSDVFDDHGHGALVYNPHPLPLDFVGVTGPRRSLMTRSALPTYFAVPYGDMMIAGCFGLVRAWADLYPDHRAAILESLGGAERGAPWELL
ncbi:MAG TPA: pyruvate formate lyase-activating protein [Chloroflexi bacterium]|nr:pyruvate formate lyase-activating protein [Chloroflexota bacterium]